jgi:DNA end-binding protein Ku
VRLEEVDPIYFDRTYFLAPAAAAAARRPYVLLLSAMRETNMAAVGRFVLRGAEKICLIRPYGDALALETLFLSEDIRSKAEIEEAVADVTIKPQELELARQVIASLAAEFEPQQLVSEYRRNLHELLEAKLGGEEIVVPEPAADREPVVDLMEALRASIAGQKKKPEPPEKARASKKAPAAAAKRTASRKSA